MRRLVLSLLLIGGILGAGTWLSRVAGDPEAMEAAGTVAADSSAVDSTDTVEMVVDSVEFVNQNIQ